MEDGGSCGADQVGVLIKPAATPPYSVCSMALVRGERVAVQLTMRGEQLGIFTHGHAVPLNPEGTSSDPTWPTVRDYLVNHYEADGDDPFWDENVWYRIDPSWMVAYSADPVGLLDQQTPV